MISSLSRVPGTVSSVRFFARSYEVSSSTAFDLSASSNRTVVFSLNFCLLFFLGCVVRTGRGIVVRMVATYA